MCIPGHGLIDAGALMRRAVESAPPKWPEWGLPQAAHQAWEAQLTLTITLTLTLTPTPNPKPNPNVGGYIGSQAGHIRLQDGGTIT